MRSHDEKIHVWLIIILYPPNFSGAAIQAQQVFRKLISHGISATVLTTSNHASAILRGTRSSDDGIEVRYVPGLRHAKWASVKEARTLRKTLAYFIRIIGKLSFGMITAWTILREGRRGDILRIYAPNPFSFLPIWAAKVNGMHPVLDMTLLGSDDPLAIKQHWNKILGFLTLESFRNAELITGHSSAQTQSYLATGLDPNKVVKIPYGVDLTVFRPASQEERVRTRQRLNLNIDGTFIVFVGGAIARKGLDVLVKAFIHVHSNIANAELLIVGPCDFTDPAYELARNLNNDLERSGLSPFVHWLGRTENVSDFMTASDIFCLPTRREGFGIAIIEAMAIGLPVIVSRLEGVTTDIVDSNREGILIDGHNPEHYAEALLRLIGHPAVANAMGKAGMNKAANEYDLDRIAGQYRKLYGLLNSPQRDSGHKGRDLQKDSGASGTWSGRD